MPRGLKLFLKTILGLVIFAAVLMGIYLLYLQAHYERISDEQIVRIEGSVPEMTALEADTPYTALTYNIGFGAYTPGFTFAMETGTMADGTKTRGERGKAISDAAVSAAMQSIIDIAKNAVTQGAEDTGAGEAPPEGEAPAPAEPVSKSPDFLLFQEVDTDSDRSYHVDQKALIKNAFPDYAAYYAVNAHSGFLAFPFHDMIGRVNSGLLTLTNVAPDSVVRRSYPIDESIPARYTDLDCCFVIMRLPVAGKSDLVLINHHMSAYSGGTIRAEQLSMLCAILSVERAQGSYVIVGGDWNHALAGSLTLYPSQQQPPEWVSAFDDAELPDGYATVRADNLDQVASCRASDIPYERGVSYTVTVDGFVVSDNVRAHATNIDTDFTYSDHNPVLLTFELAG